MNKLKIQKSFNYLIAILLVLLSIFPIVWLFLTSIKSTNEIYSWPVKIFPSQPTIQNYVNLFQMGSFGRYYLNSFIVSGSATILILITGTLAAYSFARIQFRGKRSLMMIVLALLLFPPVAIVPPLFLIFRNLNLINNYISLILGHTALYLPLAIWILMNYFRTLPKNIEDSARIDGCNTFQMIFKILLPMSLPGLIAAGLITFVFSWNEFLLSLVLLSKNEMRTVVVGISLYPGEYSFPWELISSAIVLAIIPIILLTLVFQKYIISGLTAGSTKY
ncbi:sugar ABC transporter permease [Petrotoga miotherma DSM 10691]|uniref:Sugar ABC transporter permease n=1 Tax=Petrotoga miotherma DSM 10691 TaxID=1434326 RepID=A0A2K1PAP5_9BACT|nr:carbohydrate ABC transporter permease [Petrotoga miotherma]PNR99862.1 sugar ABC transporter permease [Petrotoga miotherma DSM 10691]